VQQVESRLGLKAFAIRGRKAILTPTGQFLYRRGRALVDEASRLEQAARRVSAGWEAELRIAVEIVYPMRLLFEALDRFGRESPHTRIEVFDSVMGGTPEVLVEGLVDLAISGIVPPGLLGDPLLAVRLVLVANPAHPLHQLGRPLTADDLRAHRQLIIRESGTKRATVPTVDAAQRWTVSDIAESLQAARAGYGYAMLPELAIRDAVADGSLAALPMREGGERFGQLYLVYADRDAAGPGALRLGAIIREVADAAEAIAPVTAAPPLGKPRLKAKISGHQPG
jgi:DNA-binding transcriptional LysR family regulator